MSKIEKLKKAISTLRTGLLNYLATGSWDGLIKVQEYKWEDTKEDPVEIQRPEN